MRKRYLRTYDFLIYILTLNFTPPSVYFAAIKPKMKKTPSNKIPIASVPELDTSESSNSEYELLDSSEEGGEFGYASDENNDPLSQIQSSSQ